MIPDDISQVMTDEVKKMIDEMVDEVKTLLDYLKSTNCEQKFPDLKDDIDLLKICCKNFLHYKRKFDNKDCSLADLIFIYVECADKIVLLKDKVAIKAEEAQAAFIQN